MDSLISFSVIIPLYNKEKSVLSTIESVLNQDYEHFEIIIVNDGSTDSSLQIVKSIDDKRIKIVDKKNGGVSSARNEGIKMAQNKYVIPLDADDLWQPNCLKEFCLLIQKFSDASVFCTSYTSNSNNISKSSKRFYVNNYYLTSAISMAKWNMPIMVTGCVCISIDCFDKVGLYNEQFKQGEDYDLWLRLKDRFKIAKSEVVTLIYRLDTENRASVITWPEKEIFIDKDIQNNSNAKKLYEGCLNLVYLLSYNRNKYLKAKLNWFWVIMAAALYLWYRLINKK